MQEWYLDKFLWITLDEDEQEMLNETLKLIKDVVLSQTTRLVFVHRDFHSRNIMFKRGKSLPGIGFIKDW